jgi:hypothetical protein
LFFGGPKNPERVEKSKSVKQVEAEIPLVCRIFTTLVVHRRNLDEKGGWESGSKADTKNTLILTQIAQGFSSLPWGFCF